MNKETRIHIESVTAYIRDFVFSDHSTFWRNLMVMKYNPDLEWFNCAAIAYMGKQKNLLDDELVAYPLSIWADKLGYQEVKANEDKIQSEPFRKKSSYLIVPYFENLEEFGEIGTELSFVRMRVYFKSDIDLANSIPEEENKHKIITNVVSPFQTILDEFNFNPKRLNEKWHRNFIMNYLNNYDFYKDASQKLKDSYYAIMVSSFGNNLQINFKGEHERIDFIELNKSTDAYTQYYRIFTLLSNFINAIYIFLIQLSAMERLREKDNKDDKHLYVNGQEAIKLLAQGKAKTYDWDILMAQTESVNKDIMLSENREDDVVGASLQTESIDSTEPNNKNGKEQG